MCTEAMLAPHQDAIKVELMKYTEKLFISEKKISRNIVLTAGLSGPGSTQGFADDGTNYGYRTNGRNSEEGIALSINSGSPAEGKEQKTSSLNYLLTAWNQFLKINFTLNAYDKALLIELLDDSFFKFININERGSLRPNMTLDNIDQLGNMSRATSLNIDKYNDTLKEMTDYEDLEGTLRF